MQNQIKKIERMNDLSLNAFEEMATARNIKNYKYFLKKDLSIALIKSNESYTELLNCEDNSNTEMGETKKLFNKLRSNFSREEIKKLSEKFHKKRRRKRWFNKERRKITKKYCRVF